MKIGELVPILHQYPKGAEVFGYGKELFTPPEIEEHLVLGATQSIPLLGHQSCW